MPLLTRGDLDGCSPIFYMCGVNIPLASPFCQSHSFGGMRDLLSLTKAGDATPRLGITSIFKNRMIQHIILKKDGAVAELDCQEYGENRTGKDRQHNHNLVLDGGHR